MIAYFKKYTIFVCIIAVALPIVASTVWPLITGQMMASTIGGLILMFALFILGLLIGYAIFERKAEDIVDGYLAKYNEDCDPQSLVSEGSSLASAITFPCNQMASWFMGYYAQALLDVGRTDEAKRIAEGLRQSIAAAAKPEAKAAVVANLIPLAEKMDGTEETLGLIEEGLGFCGQARGSQATQIRDFLESQQKVLKARQAKDEKAIASMAESIRASAQYPMRIRVEYAWDEASAAYRLGDEAEERRCLEFVASHGGSLALVEKAKARLSSLS